MSAGIVIFLLLVIAIIAVAAFFLVGGAAGVGEAADGSGRRGRRRSPVREPTDEHAAGWGVGQEFDTPQPARVRRPD